jgi:hypothetical protein
VAVVVLLLPPVLLLLLLPVLLLLLVGLFHHGLPRPLLVQKAQAEGLGWLGTAAGDLSNAAARQAGRVHLRRGSRELASFCRPKCQHGARQYDGVNINIGAWSVDLDCLPAYPPALSCPACLPACVRAYLPACLPACLPPAPSSSKW